MGLRRISRELALQSLYLSEVAGKTPVESLDVVCEHFEANGKALPYARELLAGVADNWHDINMRIAGCAQNWRLDRMSLVDRNIMRITAYELLYREDIPARVAINEAIEIAKRYSTDEAIGFINGIMDAVKKSASDRSACRH